MHLHEIIFCCLKMYELKSLRKLIQNLKGTLLYHTQIVSINCGISKFR